MEPKDYMKQAVRILGGRRQMARALGCSEYIVGRMEEGVISPLSAASVERVTKGRVCRWHLLPTLYEVPADAS